MPYKSIQISSNRLRYEDDNGVPAVGYVVWTCLPGVTTLAATWSDRDLTSLNTNPIVLDARGECELWTNATRRLLFCIPTSASVGDGVILDDDYLGDQQSNFVTGSATPVTDHNNYVVSTTPAVPALSENFMLIMTPDLDNADTITSNTFTGTGNNDCTAAGPYVGSTPGSIFHVEIDSVTRDVDSSMQLILHGNEAGTTFTDVSASPKTITAHGGVDHIAGGGYGLVDAAVLFNGTDAYLSLADSDDWYLGTGDFTIEGRWTFGGADGTLVAQDQDANNTFYFDYVVATHKIRFYFKDSSAVRADYDYTFIPVVDQVYHLELVRNGTNFYLFIDGVKVTWTTTTTAISTNALGNLTGLLTLGYGARIGTYLDGTLDEFVWSKGIARHTANFTPPSQPYSTGSVDTIKWRKDGGAWTEKVAITGLAQNLIDSVTFAFATITGHTLGDYWSILVETPARVDLDTLGNLLVYKNKGGSIVALDGSDMLAGYAAQLILNEALNAWLLINPATPTFSTPTITAVRYRKPITAAYDLLLADQGYELACSGTFTLSLLTPPEFANRFVYIKNSGTGIITIDAGAYPIYGTGTSTFIVGPGSCYQLQSNGVSWDILTSTGGIFLQSSQPIVAGTVITFTDLLPGIRYRVLYEMLTDTNVRTLYMKFNNDTGTNYLSTYLVYTNASITEADINNSVFLGSLGLTLGGMGTIEFVTHPGNDKKVIGNMAGFHTDGAVVNGLNGTFLYTGAADLSRMDIYISAGTMTGSVKLYRY